ncbi:unnamed protein product [Bursaphelenchus xylophilus]|uniref:(pine wood nematode) hypothetical protein n=1 Tax=Bursaphelenchus xylophilus TaxID=6326 RepID=A0A1I7RMT1_BURXY|nr:unnamed protein product [Bursaphelenchus xylophilus]CAG9125500.1 unnamed protein product [Bursaphelenchus xylophilus]
MQFTPENIPALEEAAKIPNLLLMFVSLIGMIGNANIISATYRRKSLRSPSNIFIAFTAFGDFLHETGNIVSGYLAFTSNWVLPLDTCFNIQFVFTFGTGISAIMLFLTALDRLVCVLFPHKYNKWSKSVIISGGITISFLAVALYIFYGYLHVEKAYRYCKVWSELPFDLSTIFFVAGTIFVLLTIIFYVVIWGVLRYRNYQNSKQMLRSITAVSMCICSGWLSSMLIISYFLVVQLADDYNTVLYSGLPMEISVALNYPLLYSMSREYRAAFRRQLHSFTLGFLFIETKTESQVIALS